MSKWAGPEFGWLQIGSWLIVIVVWLAIVFFAWKYFMENPMVRTKRDRKNPESDRGRPLPPSS
jgi:hypothetical protein